MLAEYITRFLVVLFGYAYPAFECFKTLEQHPGNTRQLQFWCQYWIIVAILTVIEMVGEFLVSMLPMYGEAKLAFLVYLWYPKTKGSDLVYDTFLRPLVMQYEPDIEERFRNLRAKSGQLLIFYLKNFTEKGQILFLDVLRYVVSKASSGTEVMMRIRGRGSSSKNKKREKQGADELEDIAEALFATNAKQRGSRQHK
ncbi:putative HVA22-like protein g isoform X1 [Musa acuminata AAA Group]|uniref:putative HVA22-like protein g isoform X1 n=1 Tax=Musa acuminata AAA Group TaxID=214697 RepID=UPI0031D8FC1E